MGVSLPSFPSCFLSHHLQHPQSGTLLESSHRCPTKSRANGSPGTAPHSGVSSSLRSALLELAPTAGQDLFTTFVILNSGHKCRFLRGRSSFKAHYSDKQPEQPWPGFHWFSTWAWQGCWKQSPGAWQLLHPPAVRCRAAEDGPGPALVAWLLLLRLRSVGKGMFIEKGKGKPRK